MKLKTLQAVLSALNDAGARYLVVGGVAVNAHGYQRLTQDLDLVIQLEPKNLEPSMKALTDLGFRPLLPVRADAFADPAQRRTWIEDRNLQVFSMISDAHPDIAVDIFAAEPFEFDVEYDAAMVADLAPGLKVRFLRLPALIAMKEATGRPRDEDDAEHLRQILHLMDNDETG